METIKTAFLGLAHPHVATLYGALKRQANVSFLGFADVLPSDGQTFEERAQNFGSGAREVPFFDSWERLLDQKPDLVIIGADNNGKTEPALAALSRGILTVMEKPMCGRLSDALAMAQCAEEHHTKILTNWPIAWFPAFREAKKLADAGEVGEVRRVVYRSPATWGPYSYAPDGELPPEDWLKKTWWYQADRGGGSIFDYACYGTVLSTWMFGKEAENVAAVGKSFTTKFTDVPDYSAMLLDFGEGVGLLEGSWSTYNVGEVPTGPIIYGSDGVIVCDRHSSLVKIYHGRSHTPVAPTKILDTKANAEPWKMGDHLMDVLHGAEPDEMLETKLNLRVVATLEAGTLAAKTGQTVKPEKI